MEVRNLMSTNLTAHNVNTFQKMELTPFILEIFYPALLKKSYMIVKGIC